MKSFLDAIVSCLEEVREPDEQGSVAARCPFHDDPGDTLYVSPEQGWRCSGGGTGSLSELALHLGVPSGINPAIEMMRIDPARIADLTDLDRFPLSDVGNAAVFAHLYGHRVRFVHRGRSGGNRARDWHLWDGVRWRPDDTEQVMSLASQVWRARTAAAANMNLLDENSGVVRFGKGSGSLFRIRAMLSLARTQSPIALGPDALDQDPWLLCVKNGVVDLRTGDFRESTPNDLLSMQAGAAYEANAECPTWLRFLEEIFQDDADLIGFVQRLVGYSLTGIPADHLVICFGAGRNGKSTLISAIQDLLGDYAAQTQVATLKPQRPETIRNDLARLFGKRFVGALEQTEGGRLDEGLVKQLTGRDRVVTRFLYQEHQELVPSFKVWMGVNHKPEIKDTSQAMWERVFLIPFEAYFSREKADQHMLEKLQLERPGILDWAIKGCLAWQQQGLNPPESVKAATAEYRAESDVVERFIEDECVVREGQSVGATMLYDFFVGWCGSNDQSSMSQTAFGTRLAEKGYQKKPDSKGRTVYHGIGLRIKF